MGSWAQGLAICSFPGKRLSLNNTSVRSKPPSASHSVPALPLDRPSPWPAAGIRKPGGVWERRPEVGFPPPPVLLSPLSLSFCKLISGPPSSKFRFMGIEVHPITGTQTCRPTLYSLTFPTNFTLGLMIKWNFVRHLTVHLYGKE